MLAELRLVFHVMADPRRFHEPYLVRNRDAHAAEAGTGRPPRPVTYLDDAEKQLVDAYATADTSPTKER